MSLCTILSIDGGGIRGIIPAKILAEIERRTGKPIAKLFDFVAGTSTGGILAVGLGQPSPTTGQPQYAAADLIELYAKEGARIFHHSCWHMVKAVGNLMGPRYDGDGARTVFDQYFGATTLKQSKTRLMVTSYDIERRAPIFFKSWRAQTDAAHDFRMADVARATSAAPTYFPPVQLTNGSERYALVDGGVFANNPTMCVLADAKKLLPSDTQFFVVSLGTGNADRKLPFDDAKGWGLAGWAHPLIDILIDGVSDTVDYEARELVPDGKYHRFQTALDPSIQEMDDTHASTIEKLKACTDRLIAERASDLSAICATLKGAKFGQAVS